MSEEMYWTNARRMRIARRRLIGAAAAGSASLAGVLLAGCGNRSNQSAKSAVGGPAASTGGQPQPGGTFNTSMTVNPATLDPQASKSIQARSVAGQVMSRLFRHKTSGDPTTALSIILENDLATSAESPDGVTWTVTLRPDAKFQNIAPVNGHAVEAEDVRASYVRAINLPESAAKTYLLMVDPNQIQTPDKNTVVFKLNSAYGPFAQTIGGAVAGWIYPREIASGGYDPAKVIIGSGPFVLDNYTPDVAVVSKKNPGWFEQGRPYVDSMRTSIIPNPAQQLAQFTAGNLDELGVDVNNLDTAKHGNPKASVITAPYPNSYQIYGHMDDPASPFRDIRVRQAISMAIDREAIGKAVFNNAYHNNGVLSSAKVNWALPPDQLGDASKYFTYNLAEAKKLVDAAGAADAFKQFVYPKTAYGPQFDTIAQMLNPMLNAAGFKSQLVAVDYTSQFINVGKGILYGHYDPDTLVFAIWMSGGNIAEEALQNTLLTGYDTNHSHVDDPAVADMVKKMMALPDQNARIKAAQDIQRYAAGQLYYISSIPTGNVYTLVQPRVRDYAYTLTQDVEGTETTSKLWLAS